ncbi:MAG: hypothetical protein KDK59_07560 [Simkania sp.]|nr:hypothetical protein [Simkania sp.]
MRFLRHILCATFFFFGMLFAQVQPEVVQSLKPKLNTERIEYFFGNSGVELLEIDSPAFVEKRISNLYSIDNTGRKIMRCLAIVDFTVPIHYNLTDSHQEICTGSPIGTTLKKHGWSITKKPIYFSTISLSPELMLWMEEVETNEAALHI